MGKIPTTMSPGVNVPVLQGGTSSLVSPAMGQVSGSVVDNAEPADGFVLDKKDTPMHTSPHGGSPINKFAERTPTGGLKGGGPFDAKTADSIGRILIEARELFIKQGKGEARVSLREVKRIRDYVEVFAETQGMCRATVNALWLTLGASLGRAKREGEHADISRVGSGYFFTSKKREALFQNMEDVRANARVLDRAPGRADDFAADRRKRYHQAYEELSKKDRKRLQGLLPHEAFLGGTNIRDGIQGELKRIRLARQGDPREVEFLFVLTDGEETHMSGRSIRELCEEAKKEGIIAVGIGVGKGMQTVREKFPIHLVEDNPENLPYLLAEFIKEYAKMMQEID